MVHRRQSDVNWHSSIVFDFRARTSYTLFYSSDFTLLHGLKIRVFLKKWTQKIKSNNTSFLPSADIYANILILSVKYYDLKYICTMSYNGSRYRTKQYTGRFLFWWEMYWFYSVWKMRFITTHHVESINYSDFNLQNFEICAVTTRLWHIKVLFFVDICFIHTRGNKNSKTKKKVWYNVSFYYSKTKKIGI